MLVQIEQEYYDNLIDEINMLQELVAELSASQDTPKDAARSALEQQAATYKKLQKLLTCHPSFYEGTGLTTHSEELCDTVLELQRVWDLSKNAVTFKPISEYTIDDWEQAKEEGWVFKTEYQGVVLANAVNVEDDIVQLSGGERGTWWIVTDGRDTDEEGYTVLERIK